MRAGRAYLFILLPIILIGAVLSYLFSRTDFRDGIVDSAQYHWSMYRISDADPSNDRQAALRLGDYYAERITVPYFCYMAHAWYNRASIGLSEDASDRDRDIAAEAEKKRKDLPCYSPPREPRQETDLSKYLPCTLFSQETIDRNLQPVADKERLIEIRFGYAPSLIFADNEVASFHDLVFLLEIQDTDRYQSHFSQNPDIKEHGQQRVEHRAAALIQGSFRREAREVTVSDVPTLNFTDLLHGNETLRYELAELGLGFVAADLSEASYILDQVYCDPGRAIASPIPTE